MTDVVTAWKQARAAAKVTQVLARYRTGTNPARTCATCGFHDGAECFIVAGTACDTSTCDLWRPRDAASSKETQCSESN